jgi:hypothetical protein
MGKKKYGAWDEEGDLIHGLTLKEAARMARENGGKVWQHMTPDYTEDLEETDIDPYDEAYDTKEELRARLARSIERTEASRRRAEEANKRHKDYQRGLIDAGLIPIAALGDILTHYEIRRDPISGYEDMIFNRPTIAVVAGYETTAKVEFRVPQTGTPGNHAITALLNYRNEKRRKSS